MNKLAKIFIATLAAGAGVYVFETLRRQSDLIQNTEIRPHGAKVKLKGLHEVEVSALLELTNKSGLKFTINSYGADIYLNDVKVGTASGSPNAVVEKNSKQDYPFSVIVDPIAIIGEAGTFTGISDILSATLRMEGFYFVNNSFFFARIPFDVNHKLRELI